MIGTGANKLNKMRESVWSTSLKPILMMASEHREQREQRDSLMTLSQFCFSLWMENRNRKMKFSGSCSSFFFFEAKRPELQSGHIKYQQSTELQHLLFNSQCRQACTVGGRRDNRHKLKDEITWINNWMKGKAFTPWGQSGLGSHCPIRLYSLCPWNFSRLDWTRSGLSTACLKQELRLETSQGFPSFWIIL